jgi:hypothetical protein
MGAVIREAPPTVDDVLRRGVLVAPGVASLEALGRHRTTDLAGGFGGLGVLPGCPWPHRDEQAARGCRDRCEDLPG